MKKMLSVSVVALALSIGAPAMSATNQPLPADVVAGLQAATSPSDVAALVAANPGLAATIMFEAAALGVASPSQVVSVLAGGLNSGDLAALVFAAAEAAPSEADATAAAAAAAGGPRSVIGSAAVDGVEAAVPALSQPEVDAEAAEIMAALATGDAAQDATIAASIAGATNNPNDTGDTVLAAAGGDIETADITPTGQLRGNPGRLPSFINLPSESQASPN